MRSIHQQFRQKPSPVSIKTRIEDCAQLRLEGGWNEVTRWDKEHWSPEARSWTAKVFDEFSRFARSGYQQADLAPSSGSDAFIDVDTNSGLRRMVEYVPSVVGTCRRLTEF
uniref:Uncharacterized protein n=1 Tax=Caenorhabditis japonica TaxID=281687 RepID=A0A8R1IHG9_CAEJA